MKKLILALVALACVTAAQAQPPPNKRYPPQQLKEDVEFLQKQIFDAHANPFIEITKPQYERVFTDIQTKITDSLNATDFYKLLSPVFAYLSDEHSGLTVAPVSMDKAYSDEPVFLPFNLIKKGNEYLLNDMLQTATGLAKGDKIVRINNMPITELVERCLHYTTGFPDQRKENALKQFGYLYTWSMAKPQLHYKILTAKGEEVIVAGVARKAWLNYLNVNTGPNCSQLITYTRYGDAGYINACSFLTHGDKELDAVHLKIDSIFTIVKKDSVKCLFIDVSHNSGGDSSVGDMLISDFSGKPYKGYQCNFRRSDEYLKLSKFWGSKDSVYASKAPGSVLHFDSYTIYPPQTNPNRFNGKVYIIIGAGTFSSAMMFATIIKDNRIATLIGQTPRNGHPTHFGEIYNAELPNTKLQFRFGVKEWIRPAGKISDNYLRPDVEIAQGKYANVQELIEAVKKR